MPTTTTELVRPLLDTLVQAFGLTYTLSPLASADSETKRAISEFAPLIKETCQHRYGVIEDMTLRTYARAVTEVLNALPQPGVVVNTDLDVYDTRTANGGTVLAYQDMSDTAYPMFVISLRRAFTPFVDHARVMRIMPYVTLGEVLRTDQLMADAAFATSRKLYDAQL